jgi:pimeloyl-ACP methyl ester carboxylesterase
MIAMEPVFGTQKRDLALWDPIIVIRHGFNSSESTFSGLQGYLQGQIPNATIDNRTYRWKESVLVNGARLANEILSNYSADRPLVLIGHSMGGLVCRVANVILRDSSTFASVVTSLGFTLGYAPGEILEIKNFGFSAVSSRRVDRLITLATPNSGALLQGQVSGIAALVQTALNAFPPTRTSSVADLTSDRLFRMLQHFATDSPTLSISGSRWNRFALAAGQLTSLTRRGGIQLDLPHDSIVEDRSVDLRASVLPNEVVHNGTAPYMHLRAYTECTDITHTNIYDDYNVRQYLVRCLELTPISS